MNIIVSHVYSNDNKGDAALLSVLLRDIKRAFNAPHITILTLDTVVPGELFEGVPLKNSLMHYITDRYKNPVVRVGYGLFVFASTMFAASVYRISGANVPLPRHLQEIVRLYQEADLIIPVGGGYISSKPGVMNTARLFFVLHPLLFSYVLGKPTVNYTQSVGPFGSKLQEYMAKVSIKTLTGIVVRERISLALLKKWGITKNVLLSVDSGFSFQSTIKKDIRRDLGIPPSKLLIGVTVRNWFKPERQAAYEKVIAEFCDAIIRKYDVVIIFIPQVTVDHRRDDDRQSGERVYKYIENKQNVHFIRERYDHETIKAIYGELDLLVGTRFHSVIFALTAYVPAIAISYEHKTLGIMTDLELDQWVVDIKDTSVERLLQVFDELVTKREEYVSQLKKILPAYAAQSERSIYFVKDLYERYSARRMSGAEKYAELDKA